MVVVFGLLTASESQAAARVFVSVTGNDANTCSNVATPCRTFDASVAQVDPGGEVIVLASGSYGGVVIAKSVKIDAPVGIVAFTAATIEVSAGVSDTVALRGLTVKALTPGTGAGILYTAGKGLQVSNCVLDGWNFGIEVVGAGSITVVDTTIRNSVGGGSSAIHINHASASAVIDNVRAIDGGNNGFFVQAGKATVRDSVAAGNANNGALASSAGAQINIEKSLLANNTNRGLVAFDSGLARVSDSMVTGNGTGLDQDPPFGGTIESFGNNAVRGNATNTSGTITAVTLQ
jgi:hypothetical protein